MIEKKIGTRKVPQTITVDEPYEYEELAMTEEVFEVPVVNMVQKETIVEETYTETEEVLREGGGGRERLRASLKARPSVAPSCPL